MRGCLALVALGDAAGAPVEGRSREQVRAYGDPLAHLADPAAAVTDDTGQLEALTRALIVSRGELTVDAWRAALLDWFRTSPTADRAGPTSRSALEGQPPDPSDGRIGATNGSAMRVAPAGLVHPGDPERAVQLAWTTSRVTHDTQVAAAAAGAIAAGVAAALRPGSGVEEVTEACVLGAALGHGLGVREGRTVPAPRVSARIELAVDEGRRGGDLDESLERIDAAVGTSMLAFESVPAAVGVLAATGGDPLETVRAGVRIGGDTDTIAAIAGALAGALHGHAALAPTDRSLVELVLPPALDDLVEGLAELASR